VESVMGIVLHKEEEEEYKVLDWKKWKE